MNIGVEDIQVNIKYRNRKTICIRIEEDATITVLSPKGISKKDIQSILYKKEKWISSKIKVHKEKFKNKKNRLGVSGESYLYLGEEYILKIKEDKQKKEEFTLKDGYMILSCKNLKKAKELIEKNYRVLALNIIEKRVEFYSTYLGLDYGTVKIRTQKRRWVTKLLQQN